MKIVNILFVLCVSIFASTAFAQVDMTPHIQLNYGDIKYVMGMDAFTNRPARVYKLRDVREYLEPYFNKDGSFTGKVPVFSITIQFTKGDESTGVAIKPGQHYVIHLYQLIFANRYPTLSESIKNQPQIKPYLTLMKEWHLPQYERLESQGYFEKPMELIYNAPPFQRNMPEGLVNVLNVEEAHYYVLIFPREGRGYRSPSSYFIDDGRMNDLPKPQ